MMNNFIELSDATDRDHNDQPAFSQSFLRSWGQEIKMPDNCFLYIRKHGDCWVSYALMQFVSDDIEDTLLGNVFSGSGVGGPLGEMRHTYFGQMFDGYCFYLPTKAVTAAFKHLQLYFDC